MNGVECVMQNWGWLSTTTSRKRKDLYKPKRAMKEVESMQILESHARSKELLLPTSVHFLPVENTGPAGGHFTLV